MKRLKLPKAMLSLSPTGLLSALTIIACIINPVYPLETFSESRNPFNKFMTPSGGVDLFSGNAALSHELIELPGNNGMGIDVTLNYSSNVLLNARNNNEKAPAGWVGLGWRLGFGSITCDHKGTKTHLDDDFYYISPEGVSSRIIKRLNDDKTYTYFIENGPYDKMVPVGGDNGTYGGWIITLTSGVRLMYGDLSFTGRQANRLTYVQGERVGIVRNGASPLAYPYQWDLSRKIDLSGNTVDFYYQQETEEVVAGAWHATVRYTQESYLSKITNSQGHVVQFLLNDTATSPKERREYHIPHRTTTGEHQAFFNLYEKRFLDTVIVSNTAGEMTRFRLSYTLINTALEGEFVKRLLTKIVQSGKNGTPLTTCFEYNTDAGKAEPGASYHYGALKSIHSPTGASTSFRYDKKVISCKRTREGGFADANRVVDVFSNENNDGNLYNVVVAVNSLIPRYYYTLFQWDGNEWVKQDDIDNINPLLGNEGADPRIYVQACRNHFMVSNLHSDNDFRRKIYDYHWNGKKWEFSKVQMANGTIIECKERNLFDALGALSVEGLGIDVYASDDYFVVTYTKGPVSAWTRYAQVFQWNGNLWKSVTREFPIDYTRDTDMGSESPGFYEECTTMPNYFVLCRDDFVSAFVREKDWQPVSFLFPPEREFPPTSLFGTDTVTGTQLLIPDSSSFRKTVFCGRDYFVIGDRFATGGDAGYFKLFCWDGTSMRAQLVPNGNTLQYTGYLSPINLVALPYDDFCILETENGHANFNLYGGFAVLQRGNGTWNFSTLVNPLGVDEQFYMEFSYPTVRQRPGPMLNSLVLPDEKTIVMQFQRPPDDGSGRGIYWKLTHFLTEDSPLPCAYLQMYQFNGAKWAPVPLPVNYNNPAVTTYEGTTLGMNETAPVDDSKKVAAIPNHIFISGRTEVCVFNSDGLQWNLDQTMKGQLFSAEDFQQGMFANYGTIDCIGGDDFFVLNPLWYTDSKPGEMDPDDAYKFDALFYYYFDDKIWQRKGGRDDFGQPGMIKGARVHNNNIFGVSYNASEAGMALRYKYLNEFTSNTFYSYAVRTKTIEPGFGKNNIIINHEYDSTSAKIDASSGSAKFNRMSVSQPNSGKTDSYFFNGFAIDSLPSNNQAAYCTPADDYKLLEGRLYKTDVFDNAGMGDAARKPIFSTGNYYEANKRDVWPLGAYDKRVVKTENDSMQVKRVEEILQFNEMNGQPSIARTKNSDGKQKLTKTNFAFEQSAYSTGMGPSGLNMLTQPYQTTIYEKADGDMSTTFSPLEARSSQITTWSDTLGCAAWVPYRTYVWSVPKNENGIPLSGLVDFNASAPDPNVWKWSGTFEKYNTFGQSLQAKKPNRQYSTVAMYRNDIGVPIGAIDGANFEECGILTGDYDMDEDNAWFDKSNGWQKGAAFTGGVVEMSTDAHFGQRSIHVREGYSAVKIIKPSTSIDYIFSAWIKPLNGKQFVRFGVELHAANGDVMGEQIGTVDYVTENLEENKWQLVTHTVKASELASHLTSGHSASEIAYFRIWIGRSSQDAAGKTDFCMDDIRFCPSRSLISTNFYDETWQNERVIVDANNNPGALSTFDEFGRLSHVYKLNKNMGSQETGATTLLQSKKYYLTGPGPSQPADPTPADGSMLQYPGTVTLSWACTHPMGKEMEFDVYGGTDPDNLSFLSTVTAESYTITEVGFVTYYWQIVAREIESGVITKGPVWSFTTEYKPLADNLPEGWAGTLSSVRHTITEPSVCYFSWDCITSPNGLPISFTIAIINDDTPHVVTCGGCNLGDERCESPGIGIDTIPSPSGNWTLTIDDGSGKAGSTYTTPLQNYPAVIAND